MKMIYLSVILIYTSNAKLLFAQHSNIILNFTNSKYFNILQA